MYTDLHRNIKTWYTVQLIVSHYSTDLQGAAICQEKQHFISIADRDEEDCKLVNIDVNNVAHKLLILVDILENMVHQVKGNFVEESSLDLSLPYLTRSFLSILITLFWLNVLYCIGCLCDSLFLPHSRARLWQNQWRSLQLPQLPGSITWLQSDTTQVTQSVHTLT